MAENENPYEDLVSIGNMTREEADAQWAKDKGGEPAGDPAPTPDPEPTPAGDEPKGDDPAPSGDPAPAAEPFYKGLGFDTEDAVVAEINESRTMRERISALQAKEAELAEKEQVISKFENPYSNDVVAKLDKAVEKTGITDLNVLVKLVGTTAESVAGDPITAIVAAKVIDNPSILSGGITFANLIDIEKHKLEKSGLDLEDKTSIEYMSLLVESNSALTKINKFQEDLSNVQGKYNFAKENSQRAAEKLTQDVAFLTPKVEELLKSDKRTFEVEGVKFDVSLSKEDKERIKANATQHAAKMGLDLNTAQGAKVLNDLVGIYAKGASVSSGDFEKSLYKAVEAKVRAEVLDESSQGKPDTRSKPAGSGSAKGKTETDMLYERLEREARGH